MVFLGEKMKHEAQIMRRAAFSLLESLRAKFRGRMAGEDEFRFPSRL